MFLSVFQLRNTGAIISPENHSCSPAHENNSEILGAIIFFFWIQLQMVIFQRIPVGMTQVCREMSSVLSFGVHGWSQRDSSRALASPVMGRWLVMTQPNPKAGLLRMLSLPSLSLGIPTATFSWLRPVKSPSTEHANANLCLPGNPANLLPRGWFQ